MYGTSCFDELLPRHDACTCTSCVLEHFWRPCSKLWLGNNQLTELPEAICQLNALQQLFVEGNKLQHLPPGLASMPSLQRVYVAGNELQQVDAQLQPLVADTAPRSAHSGAPRTSLDIRSAKDVQRGTAE